MACGTGKTFTTLWIKEAMDAQTTLVLLPSLNLLSQTMREWSWGSNSDFDILNVCSDKSVGKTSEDMTAAEAPFPVTSEPEEIAAFLKKPSRKVLFCTYQSSPLIAEVKKTNQYPFDPAIADEAPFIGKAEAGFRQFWMLQKSDRTSASSQLQHLDTLERTCEMRPSSEIKKSLGWMMRTSLVQSYTL